MVQKSSNLEVVLNEAIGGRTIPRLGFCPQSPTEALKYYRNQLGSALAAAQDAFKTARGQLARTNDALDTTKAAIDKLLATNPDPTTPRSLSELTDALGGLQPGADREQLEQRAARAFDLNIINGVLFPKGETDLSALRALARSLGITAENCDLSAFGAAAAGTTGAAAVGNPAAVAAAADGASSIVGVDDGFLLVTTQNVTTERVVGTTCGQDIVEYDVTEQPLGTNVNVDQAAAAAGVDPAEVNVQLFWLDQVRTDPAALRRLKGLGLTAEELGAAVTGQSAGRLTGQTVDTSVIQQLRKRLTDEEICALLARPDTGGITPDPTTDQLLSTIAEALNTNTGSNRNTAGTDEEATDGDAADGDNGPILLAALLDWFRTIPLNFIITPHVSAFMHVSITTEGVELTEDDEPETTAETLARETAGVSECDTIFNMVLESIRALDLLLQEARDFFRDLYSSLGLGSNQVSAGLGVATCLASFGLGLDLSIDISIGLPFIFETFLATFATLLTTVVAAIAAFKLVVCQPQAIISLLYGGVCGFKPYDFKGCPPNLSEAVDRLRNILTLVLSLVGKLTGATRTMKVDFQYSAALATNLKNFNPCVLAATAIAIALGLDNEEQFVTATPSLESTFD